MEIKAGQMMEPEFMIAMTGLLKRELPMPQCVAISDAITELETHLKSIDRIRKGILEKYLEKDENGLPLFLDEAKQRPKFISAEAEKAFMEESSALIKTEYEVAFDEANMVVLTKDDRMSPKHYRLLQNKFVRYDSK